MIYEPNVFYKYGGELCQQRMKVVNESEWEPVKSLPFL